MKPQVSIKGKEALEYLYYKERKKERLQNHFIKASFIIIPAVLLFISVMYVHDIGDEKYHRYPLSGLGYTYILDFPIPTWMLYWIVLSIGLGWIFHGVGFHIIKR